MSGSIPHATGREAVRDERPGRARRTSARRCTGDRARSCERSRRSCIHRWLQRPSGPTCKSRGAAVARRRRHGVADEGPVHPISAIPDRDVATARSGRIHVVRTPDSDDHRVRRIRVDRQRRHSDARDSRCDADGRERQKDGNHSQETSEYPSANRSDGVVGRRPGSVAGIEPIRATSVWNAYTDAWRSLRVCVRGCLKSHLHLADL